MAEPAEQSSRPFLGKRLLLLPFMAVLLGGCSDLPKDPRGTTEKVTGGAIRVGIADNPPWTRTSSGPAGVEVELVEGFAESLGARIKWHTGSEGVLLAQLNKFELDIVISGLRANTPWKSRIATTIPYLSADTDGDGKKERRIMAVPPGENGWLVRLDRFLHANQRQALILFSRFARTEDDTVEPNTALRPALNVAP